jgi:hypothetical protein
MVPSLTPERAQHALNCIQRAPNFYGRTHIEDILTLLLEEAEKENHAKQDQNRAQGAHALQRKGSR